ncbi:hypothetical protein EV193_10966 [Herbihabitans rhizosphaerae]|uniref:V8-like Glu-specific endopeptidase n=1 Tax=Herbihabitans rhizosphaerae TaxID=1872711 RepID=A0A4Q7KGN3_9PSEU|nr:peptidase [Herbihabitans rhizosphaerae]RZS34279.1 hypothetical protein EV193_10966 [Herbihabitans rhizosphaerae]
MNRRIWQSAVVLAASTIALAGLSVPSSAESAAPRGPAVNDIAATASVATTWTADAMRSAVPLDTLLPAADAKRLTHKVAKGASQVVRPTVLGGILGPLAFPSGGAEWTRGGAVQKTAGRVFFSYQGRKASCSGDAVTSGNKSTVLTAGHCVKLEGNWHADWVFVPAYRDGNAPYGTWTARKTLATPQWAASEDINYDVGAAVVNQLDGKNLTDVVGGQGVAFNQAKTQNMYAFGWPAAAPYDGSKMIYCSGRTFNALLSDGIGMNCNMTGGSSGGPWFAQFNESTGAGVQQSVNSYKINIIPFWMFGPYFGADAQGVYNTAQGT